MEDGQHSRMPVYVVATQTDPTRRALGVARSLAHARETSVVIVVPPPERTPTDAGETIHTRALVATHAPDARVLLAPHGGLRRVSRLLPLGSTIVLSGPIRHFLETDEQYLARELTQRGHEVVFLPSPAQ